MLEKEALAKHLYSIRFRPDLYVGFRKVAKADGYTATAAFERFISDCVEAGRMVFPDLGTLDLEAEARILIDWLSKGQYFYRTEDGSEYNIRGRLLGLLPKIHDNSLKNSIEECLKKSVAQN